MKKTRIIWRGFIWRLIILALVAIFGYGIFVFAKINRLEKNLHFSATDQSDSSPTFFQTAQNLLFSDKNPLRGETDGRINILLAGMGGEGHKGKYLTDTLMMVSLDPVSHRSAMLSIPRDLFVQIPSQKIQTKINAIYTYALINQTESPHQAIETLKTTVSEVTGQPLHYYVLLDFEGFKKIIAELGGIDVDVPHDIYDPAYPGPNYSYQTFEIKKGWQHLDAETALKYARVRHTQGGDFGRAARQQQVLAAARKKAFSLGTLLNPAKLGRLLDSLGKNLQTDIAFSEIPSFLDLIDQINIYQTTNRVLDAWSPGALLASTHIELGGVWAYALLPRAKNYSEIHELAENIFQLDQLEKKKQAIAEEDADILLLTEEDADRQKLQKVFKKFDYPVVIAVSPREASVQEADSSQEEVLCPAQDALISFSPEPKLFTLDDLTAKLELTVQYQDPPSADFNYDILICLSSTGAQYFSRQNQQPEEEQYQQQSIVTEDGAVLVR